MHIFNQGASRTAAKGRGGGSSWETPKINKATGAVRDLPVTFHDRIKSSGYGQNIPKPQSFAAKAKHKRSVSTKGTGAEVYSERTAASVQKESNPGLRSLSAPRGRAGTSKPAAPAGRLIRAYPMDCLPCLNHQSQNDFPQRILSGKGVKGECRAVGPIHNIQFSEDGAWLGLVSQDSAVETLKTPIGRHSGGGQYDK